MPDENTTTQPAPEPKLKNIHQAIAAVMADVGGVAKGRKNVQQGYNFRGIADVYLACQPIMAKHGMHVAPEEIVDYHLDELATKSGGQMWRVRIKVRFRAWGPDGSSVRLEALGEAMDTGDKASNKAMSAAMKYCLVQLFALPEEDPEIDIETKSPETVATAKTDAAKPAEKLKLSPEEQKKIIRVQALAIAVKEAGIPDAERLPWMGIELGKEVKSSKDLSLDEIEKLFAALAKRMAAKGGAA